MKLLKLSGRIAVLLVIACSALQLGAQTQSDTADTPAEDQIFLRTQNSEPEEPAADTPASPNLWNFVYMMLVLAGVAGAIYGVLYFIKRVSKPAGAQNDLIQVVSSHALGGTKAVHLIRVGSQIFLVGSTDHNVQLVSEISDAETIDEIRINESQDKPASGGKAFSDFLSGFVAGPRRESSTQANETAVFLKGQRNRLKDL